MTKRINITLADKIRLARSKPKLSVEKVLDKNEHSVISRWIRTFRIDAGVMSSRSNLVYFEFTEWCKQAKIQYAPTHNAWGRIMKQIVIFKRHKTGVVYFMNKSVEEIKKLREQNDKETN